MKERFNVIFKKFLQPENYRIALVDVGASGGIERPWSDYKDNIFLIGFEPEGEAIRKLLVDHIKTKSIVIPSAVGECSGKCEFYITKKKGHSSILKPNFPLMDRYPYWSSRSEIMRVEHIQIEPIDKLLAKWNIDDVDFIKLDTQGSELAILHGGTSMLRGAFGVEVEVEFVELYKDQPLFANVDIFMRQQGFELIDIRRHHELRGKWHDAFPNCNGQLICGDALYMKSYDEYIGQWIGQRDSGDLKSRVIKAVCICIIYGMLDIAVEFVDRTPSSIIPEIDKLFLKAIIINDHKLGSKCILKKWSRKLLKKAADVLRHRYSSEITRKDVWLGSIRR